MGLILSLAAALAYSALAAAAWRGAGAGPRQQWGLVAACGLHAVSLAWALWGAAVPRFGFAPALSMTLCLVLAVYAIERQVFPAIGMRWTLFVLAASAVCSAQLYPGKPHVHTAGLLALHWVLGLAAYGMFAAALMHAWLMREAERQLRGATGQNQGLPLLGLERLMFRFIAVGFVLLSATLLAGIVLGLEAWRWDHKTVFSLLAWLVFAMLLIGRKLAGWRGQRATRMVVTGSVLLLLAYVGSRFVLEVVLKR